MMWRGLENVQKFQGRVHRDNQQLLTAPLLGVGFHHFLAVASLFHSLHKYEMIFKYLFVSADTSHLMASIDFQFSPSRIQLLIDDSASDVCLQSQVKTIRNNKADHFLKQRFAILKSSFSVRKKELSFILCIKTHLPYYPNFKARLCVNRITEFSYLFCV